MYLYIYIYIIYCCVCYTNHHTMLSSLCLYSFFYSLSLLITSFEKTIFFQLVQGLPQNMVLIYTYFCAYINFIYSMSVSGLRVTSYHTYAFDSHLCRMCSVAGGFSFSMFSGHAFTSNINNSRAVYCSFHSFRVSSTSEPLLSLFNGLLRDLLFFSDVEVWGVVLGLSKRSRQEPSLFCLQHRSLLIIGQWFYIYKYNAVRGHVDT